MTLGAAGKSVSPPCSSASPAPSPAPWKQHHCSRATSTYSQHLRYPVPCLLSRCHCELKLGHKRKKSHRSHKRGAPPQHPSATPWKASLTLSRQPRESVQSCWRESDSDTPLQADEANKDTCVFCRFSANGLQIWWVRRADPPLPSEMSWVKLSSSVWYPSRRGGKSPTSTASESLLGIFGLSTNSTHKTREVIQRRVLCLEA